MNKLGLIEPHPIWNIAMTWHKCNFKAIKPKKRKEK